MGRGLTRFHLLVEEDVISELFNHLDEPSEGKVTFKKFKMVCVEIKQEEEEGEGGGEEEAMLGA